MKRRLRSISVPRIGRKTRLLNLAVERGWVRFGDAEWKIAEEAIPGIAPEDLQVLTIPVDAPWCGVRQHNLDDLEASLCDLAQVYQVREDLRRRCRELVIRAKDHARWASRSARVAAEKRRLKAEMAEWMLIWLGDPGLFPAWVTIRQAKLRQVIREAWQAGNGMGS
jgi:hypothetical protein